MVRNFWCRMKVDGRDRVQATGPVGKLDGMEVVLAQRVGGSSMEVVRLNCFARDDGRLRTEVVVNGQVVVNVLSHRDEPGSTVWPGGMGS